MLFTASSAIKRAKGLRSFERTSVAFRGSEDLGDTFIKRCAPLLVLEDRGLARLSGRFNAAQRRREDDIA